MFPPLRSRRLDQSNKTGGAMMRLAISAVAATAVLLAQPALALAQTPEQTFFGPKQYDHAAAGTSFAADIVTVPENATAPFALRVRNGEDRAAVDAAVTLGATTALGLTIAPVQTTDTVVPLETTPAGVASVPASVTVPAGQAKVDVPIGTIAFGQAGVTARLNGSSASALVNVVP